MNKITDFLEFFLFNQIPLLEYIVEIIICIYFCFRFYKKSQFEYDKSIKIKTLCLVILKSVIPICVINFLFNKFFEPFATTMVNVYNIPIILKPIICFVTLSIFEKVCDEIGGNSI